MSIARAERRREPRVRSTGVVTIRVEDESGPVFEAELVDMSPGGFRVAHHQPSLERGTDVSYRHDKAAGKARVMWNRLAGGRVETGFRIL